jgi:hypothetical protein
LSEEESQEEAEEDRLKLVAPGEKDLDGEEVALVATL